MTIDRNSSVKRASLSELARNYGIYVIVLGGLLLRVVSLSHGSELRLLHDEVAYHRRAAALLNDFGDYRGAFRPPLYPYALAVGFTFVGDSRFSIGFVQALLEAANIALIYAIAQTLFKRREVSLLAALLYALYPEFVFFTRLLYPEIVFIFLTSTAFWLLMRQLRSSARLPLLVAGVLLGAAALAREVGATFAIIVIPLWLFVALSPRWKQALVKSALLWGGLALVLAPWAARNWTLQHRLILVSTAGEWNVVKDSLVAVNQKTGTMQEYTRLQRQVRKQFNQQKKSPTRIRPEEYVAEGLRVARQSPAPWLQAKLQWLRGLWEPVSLAQSYLRTEDIDPRLAAMLDPLVSAFFVALTLLATWGLLFSRDDAPKLLIALYLLYLILVFIATHFQERYRVPLMVLLMPYAAFGFFHLGEWLRARRLGLSDWKQPRGLAAGVTACLFVLLMAR